jgi:hypothetical protein
MGDDDPGLRWRRLDGVSSQDKMALWRSPTAVLENKAARRNTIARRPCMGVVAGRGLVR